MLPQVFLNELLKEPEYLTNNPPTHFGDDTVWERVCWQPSVYRETIPERLRNLRVVHQGLGGDVSIPYPGIDLQPNRDARWFWLSDGSVLINQDPRTEGPWEVDRMTPSEVYWPSPERVRELLPSWVDILYRSLQETYQNFLDHEAECGERSSPEYPDLGEYWLHAKRRYWIKNNPLTRLMFLVGVDPDGRARHLFQPIPEYLGLALREADYLVATQRLGLEIEPSDIDGVF